MSAKERPWESEEVIQSCVIEFDVDEPIVWIRGQKAIRYPIGQEVKFSDVEILVAESDLPFWNGELREKGLSGSFLRCKPNAQFPYGVLQVVRLDRGSTCWTTGRQMS